MKLFTYEELLYLDGKGIEIMALLYQNHETKLIQIDSYSYIKVTAKLGINEFKPGAAIPIYDLMSAVWLPIKPRWY